MGDTNPALSNDRAALALSPGGLFEAEIVTSAMTEPLNGIVSPCAKPAKSLPSEYMMVLADSAANYLDSSFRWKTIGMRAGLTAFCRRGFLSRDSLGWPIIFCQPL